MNAIITDQSFKKISSTKCGWAAGTVGYVKYQDHKNSLKERFGLIMSAPQPQYTLTVISCKYKSQD